MSEELREKVIKGLEYCIDYAQRVKDFMNDVPCEGCPYVALKPITVGQGDCIEALSKDIIALLKAQQPRLLTLEEVQSAEVVWIEQVGKIVPAIKVYTYQDGIGAMAFAYPYEGSTYLVNIHPDYYGKVSRCWTSRPTDEQREAEPWRMI